MTTIDEWSQMLFQADRAVRRVFASPEDVPAGDGWMTAEAQARLDPDGDGRMGGGPAVRRALSARHAGRGSYVIVDADGARVAAGLTRDDARHFNGLDDADRADLVAKNLAAG